MDYFVVIVASALLGSMVFFPAVVAPLVFRTLPADNAGAFLRSMFPRYYLWGAALSAVALAATLGRPVVDAVVLAVVLVGFVVSRQLLMPGINAARDAMVAGGGAQARQRFRRLHGLSVLVNVAQIALLGLLLLRYLRPAG